MVAGILPLANQASFQAVGIRPWVNQASYLAVSILPLVDLASSLVTLASFQVVPSLVVVDTLVVEASYLAAEDILVVEASSLVTLASFRVALAFLTFKAVLDIRVIPAFMVVLLLGTF